MSESFQTQRPLREQVEALASAIKVSRIELEGPLVAVYAENGEILAQQKQLVSTLAKGLRRRVDLRAAPESRLDTAEARDAIIELAGDKAGIASLSFSDATGEESALDLLFFNSSITTGTNNTAYDLSEADSKEALGVVAVLAADYVATATASVARIAPDLDFQVSSGIVLFLQIVTRGTPTYAGANDLQLRVLIEKN